MRTTRVPALLGMCGALAACQSQEQKDAALQAAVLSRDHRGITKALARGANPNQHISDGFPLLDAAVAVCDEDVVRAMIAAKADPNLSSKSSVGTVSGWTPLMRAASNQGCGAALVALLLRAGADPNRRREGGDTALMFVGRPSVAESLEKARLLLAAKADVHAQNDKGKTALMIASSEGHPALVKLLGEHGANVIEGTMTFYESDDPDLPPSRSGIASPSIRRCWRAASTSRTLIADRLVDANFAILDRIAEELDEIEDPVLAAPGQEDLHRIFLLKRHLVAMRKVLSPQRDVFIRILRRGRRPGLPAPVSAGPRSARRLTSSNA